MSSCLSQKTGWQTPSQRGDEVKKDRSADSRALLTEQQQARPNRDCWCGLSPPRLRHEPNIHGDAGQHEGCEVLWCHLDSDVWDFPTAAERGLGVRDLSRFRGSGSSHGHVSFMLCLQFPRLFVSIPA